jgi:acetoacetyl-CoA synthetase
MDKPLWQPSPERIASANLTAFRRHARERWGVTARDYSELHRWSVTEPAQFWQSVWSFCGVIGDPGGGPALVDGERMPGARWFPEARLNFAENLLRRRDRSPAIVFWGEDRLKSEVTCAELYAEVSRLSQALREAGVRPGDRVAGYMPNVPGAIIAMLATATVGATWSSCSPDFGAQGVLDRFSQIEPRVLFSADG